MISHAEQEEGAVVSDEPQKPPDEIEVLLPGFIEAQANVQAGVPCLVGTRIPFYVGMGWVWESLDRPRQEHLTREQIIALAAFDAGFEWHRSRKRQADWQKRVAHWWAEYNRMQGYTP